MSFPDEPSEEHKLSPGARFAERYTVESRLGEGASGTVYLARREPGDERVALKVIHRHLCGKRQIYKRFHREAAILGRLEGDHVVKLLELVEHEGLLALALEYVDGTSLEAMLAGAAPLGPDLAVHIAIEVCAALEAAHAAGVIHRDLKPANVLIEREAPPGSRRAGAPALPGRVRVVDFGLAKVVQGDQMTTSLTEQDMIFGTPEYMAPEQVRGDEQVDARCDVYALGCMLYEMAVGKPPFQRRTAMGVMTAHLTEEPAPPRAARPGGAISAGLEAVILRALAKRPEDRHASARALADALDACLTQSQVITPARGPALPAEAAISTTDLQLSRSALEHSPTIPSEAPSDPPDEPRPALASPQASASGVRDIGLARTLPVSAGARRTATTTTPPTLPSPKDPPGAGRMRRAPTPVSGPPPARWSDRWLWIVVAIVFAAIGVAIGTLFGTR
ncbi:MAG: protein kinase [Polyangiaceae bacterium]|nr:protein kinase [Polyangiaceae bacterium]